MIRFRYILPFFAGILFLGGMTILAPAAHADCYDTGCTGDLVCKGAVGSATCQANAATCSPACSGATPICNQNSNGTFSCIAVAADQTSIIGATTCSSACTGNQVCVSQGGVSSCQDAPTVTDSSGAAAKTPTPQSNQISETSDTLDFVMSVIMSAFAWLLGVAAITLDNAMYYTVVHMGSYINGLSAVGVAWRILRDIGNIILLFGFIALGITVILDVDWYGGGTKMLPRLIIAALFLNFSLFAAEAVIDVGNLFATEFYTQINGGSAAAPSGYSGTDIASNGISNAVMNQLGLQTIYSSAVQNTVNSNGQTSGLGIFKQGNPFIVGFMAIILFLIAAFVFFSLAFILIVRFVVLILLIIIAPIGFAGLAVPKLDGAAKQWWGTLFEQTITAPVMLLMLYVALAVITDTQFLTGFTSGGATGSAASNAAASSWTAWLTTGNAGVGGLASIILSFLVAMGLLLTVTFLSKKLGAIGGSWATKMAGAATFGVAGYAARGTVGWGLTRASQRFNKSSLSRVPVLGRSFAGVLNAGAKSSFDVRGSSYAGDALKTLGTDAGKAHKGGYVDDEKAAIKARETYAKDLKNTSGEKARIEQLEKDKKKTATEGQVAIATLRTQHAADAERVRLEAERKQQQQDIAAKRAVANAPGATQQQKNDLLAAELGLNNTVAELGTVLKKQGEEVATKEAELKKADEGFTKSIATETVKPQVQYARGIAPGSPDNFWNKWINPTRNTEAAAHIIKAATKTKAEKDSDKIFELLEKAANKEEKKDSGGGEKKEEAH